MGSLVGRRRWRPSLRRTVGGAFCERHLEYAFTMIARVDEARTRRGTRVDKKDLRCFGRKKTNLRCVAHEPKEIRLQANEEGTTASRARRIAPTDVTSFHSTPMS